MKTKQNLEAFFGRFVFQRAFCYSQSILQGPILGWEPSGARQNLEEKAQNCNLELWGFFSEWSYFLLQRATTRLHQHTLFNFRAIWPFGGGTIWWEQGKVVFDLDLWCAKKSEVHNWTYNCISITLLKRGLESRIQSTYTCNVEANNLKRDIAQNFTRIDCCIIFQQEELHHNRFTSEKHF